VVNVPRPRNFDDRDFTLPANIPRTVLVIDDHRTFADLLEVALSAEPDLHCLGVAYDLDAGLSLVELHRPDLVVLDLQFDGDQRDGMDVAAIVTARYPETRVVMLTGHADPGLLKRAADAGASSLMPKDGSLPDLLLALRTARRGGLVVHPTLLKTLVSGRRLEHRPQTSLSNREHDVLSMLMIGLDARAIADQLGISLSTCRGYVKTLLRKLDAHSQLEAVAIARRQGLVDADDRR